MLTFQQKKDFMMAQLFQAKSLNSSEKLVALCMVFKIDDHGRSDIRVTELSDMARRHERTIRHIIHALQAKIDLHVTFSQGKNVYTFIQWAQL